MTEFRSELGAFTQRLRRYARALRRDPTAADDLVQDTLVRALAREQQWQPGTNLRAWLFTIMHNEHINTVRASARRGGAPVTFDDAVGTVCSSATQTTGLELADLQRALDELPNSQRAVLLLIGLEELGYDEVGKVLGIPVGTVRSRLFRGRAKLRSLMDEPMRLPSRSRSRRKATAAAEMRAAA